VLEVYNSNEEEEWGFFVQDFTLEEIQPLRVLQPPQSSLKTNGRATQSYDDKLFQIPTLEELLLLVSQDTSGDKISLHVEISSTRSTHSNTDGGNVQKRHDALWAALQTDGLQVDGINHPHDCETSASASSIGLVLSSHDMAFLHLLSSTSTTANTTMSPYLLLLLTSDQCTNLNWKQDIQTNLNILNGIGAEIDCLRDETTGQDVLIKEDDDEGGESTLVQLAHENNLAIHARFVEEQHKKEEDIKALLEELICASRRKRQHGGAAAVDGIVTVYADYALELSKFNCELLSSSSPKTTENSSIFPPSLTSDQAAVWIIISSTIMLIVILSIWLLLKCLKKDSTHQKKMEEEQKITKRSEHSGMAKSMGGTTITWMEVKRNNESGNDDIESKQIKKMKRTSSVEDAMTIAAQVAAFV